MASNFSAFFTELFYNLRIRNRFATPLTSNRVDRVLTQTGPSPLPAALRIVAAGEGRSGVDSATDESSPDPPREVEIKFITDPDGLAATLASPFLRAAVATPGRKLTSVYFDTPEWDLHKNRMALRVRRAGRGAPVMTLKWPPEGGEGVFVRGEIELPVAGFEPDLALFHGEMAERLKLILGESRLEAKYETRVWRVTRLVDQGTARIEAACDEGVILVGGPSSGTSSSLSGERSRPLCELELELKSGPPRALYELGADLAENLPLVLDIASKAERACHFANETAPVPVKARPAALPPGIILDEAISRIVSGACDHYIANWAPLRESDDPEAIHQMRVALRRLRAALAMFGRAIPCAEFEQFRDEAQALASALGPARDCDALREMVAAGPLAHFGERKDFSPLLDALEARRHDAYGHARVLMASGKPTLFILRLSAFAARRGWRNALSGEDLAVLTGSVEAFAVEALERLYKRVRRRGKDIASLPDEARHRARIALKNLRYGAEFFAPCFGDPRAASTFIKATAQLQGLLGAHNDAASADHFLSLPHDYEAARAAGLVTGWFARGAVIADENLAKDWKKFKQLKPFWR